MRRNDIADTGQLRGHVAFDIEHQHLVAAIDSLKHEVQHRGGLARAGTAPDEEVTAFAVAADGNAGWKLKSRL